MNFAGMMGNERKVAEKEIKMTKSYLLFTAGALGGSIYFYNSNALISLFCLGLFVMCCYGAGKLG